MLSEKQLSRFQYVLLLILVVLLPLIGLIFDIKKGVLYFQVILFFGGGIFIFYQLWLQKRDDEIKRRLVQILLMVGLFAGYHLIRNAYFTQSSVEKILGH